MRRVSEPLIIFTEYRDTLRHVASAVGADAAGSGVVAGLVAAGLTLVVAGSAGLLGGNAWWLAVGSRPAWYSIPGLVLR